MGGAWDAPPPRLFIDSDPPAFIWLTVALKVAIKNRLKFVFLFLFKLVHFQK